jgi:transposase
MLLPRDTQVYLAIGVTDMRKQINGLSIMVEQALSLNPFTGDLFAFCNRRCNMIKILYWDKNGFCLWHKRLEKHLFKWPRTEEEILLIGPRELNWLLDGLDFTVAHGQLNYRAVA